MWPLLSLTLNLLLTSTSAQRQPRPRGCVVDNIDMCGYESHRQMVDRFMRIKTYYPHIAKVKD